MTEPETPAYVLVILPTQDIRLPEVLRHIEAGRIVLVILTPGTKAKPKGQRCGAVRAWAVPVACRLDLAGFS
jgi:hypothetical protein